jgi:hypothetical protein
MTLFPSFYSNLIMNWSDFIFIKNFVIKYIKAKTRINQFQKDLVYSLCYKLQQMDNLTEQFNFSNLLLINQKKKTQPSQQALNLLFYLSI